MPSKLSFPSRQSVRAALGQLPQQLLAPGAHIPFALQRWPLERMFAHLFREPIEQGEFDFLQNRWLAIECRDPALRYLFSCSPQREVLIRNQGSADVTIRGSLQGLCALAAQRCDPDTLFFQRILSLEGDTELGLEVKNLLDRQDHRQWPPELQFFVRATADWLELFTPH